MEYSAYYETKLYPIQNEILKNLKNLELPFYLTGGTALSRGYFNHRYSDDLDLFVNNDSSFLAYTEAAINCFKKAGYLINTDTMTENYVRIYINAGLNGLSKKGLKIDFVNDVAAHFDDIKETPIYYRTDSLRNILSNKYTALYRISVKDVVDICEIAKHYKFSWKDIIKEAEQKEAGIDLKEVSEIFRSFTDTSFLKIHWKKDINLNKLKENISKIACDIMTLGDNSLYNQIKRNKHHDTGYER